MAARLRLALEFLRDLPDSDLLPVSALERQSEGLGFSPEDLRAALLLRRKIASRVEKSPPLAGPELVRQYFEESSPTIVSQFGTTYQAALFGKSDLQASNLFFASRAGLAGASRILDAGCGCGGPAMDIAKAFPKCSIKGVTLSPAQAEVARHHIEAQGLSQRIDISVQDYHRTDFEADSFDTVVFFESAGYSKSLKDLFAEMRRLLKRGGRLYLKEPFLRHPVEAGEPAQAEVDEILRVYRYHMYTQGEYLEALTSAGFERAAASDLSDCVSTAEYFGKAMFDDQGRPTTFGAGHHIAFSHIPSFYGDILAFAG